jgi:hypothetical protein
MCSLTHACVRVVVELFVGLSRRRGLWGGGGRRERGGWGGGVLAAVPISHNCERIDPHTRVFFLAHAPLTFTQGPQLYYVDSDGTRLHASDKMPYFSVGSGSTFAYGVLDSR